VFESIENIRLLDFTESETKNITITDRKSHMFIFRTGGDGIFDFGNKRTDSPKGSLIFIPKGSSYKFTITSDEPCSSVRISFLADIENPTPEKYILKGFADINKITSGSVAMWKTHAPASKHKCLSLFHNLISFLINAEQADYFDSRKYNLIKPAVKHLDAHLFESDFSIDTLPDLCGISPSYFRRIFYANFKTNPGKYIEEKRLNQANAIIESGDFDTIYEVAKKVGYNDPLYFGKVFKKKFGISPSHTYKK